MCFNYHTVFPLLEGLLDWERLRPQPSKPFWKSVKVGLLATILLASCQFIYGSDSNGGIRYKYAITHPVAVSTGVTLHYSDVIMGAMASLITSLTSVYSTVYPDADQRKHQSSASLAFVWGIHRGPVNFTNSLLLTLWWDLILPHRWTYRSTISSFSTSLRAALIWQGIFIGSTSTVFSKSNHWYWLFSWMFMANGSESNKQCMKYTWIQSWTIGNVYVHINSNENTTTSHDWTFCQLNNIYEHVNHK